MPPQLLFDISGIDLNHIEFGPDEIRRQNPHRDQMEMLNGVVWFAAKNHRILGFKDMRSDECCVSGHVPGRPLLPAGAFTCWRKKSGSAIVESAAIFRAWSMGRSPSKRR